MSEFETSIEIAADPETVFDYLVTNEGMTLWMGTYADLDPRPGGQFAVDIAGSAVRGTFLVVDRPKRVVVSWGMAGAESLPPGASKVSFSLTAIDIGTRVQLHHTELPAVQVDGHIDGWTHFLPRLRLAAIGQPAGDDTWMPASD